MPAQSDNTNKVTSQVHISPQGKEAEVISLKEAEKFEEIPPKHEIPPDVERAGVRKIGDIIELPPDVKKLGVTPSGPQTPVSAVSGSVSLPLSDDKVYQGFTLPISSAWHWLSVWCTKKLHKAHLVLKQIHGKIIRVKIKNG